MARSTHRGRTQPGIPSSLYTNSPQVNAGIEIEPADWVLIDRLCEKLRDGASFWRVVYRPFMNRNLARRHVVEIVSRGLAEARGNYTNLVLQFNMPLEDRAQFMSFLSEHRCRPKPIM